MAVAQQDAHVLIGAVRDRDVGDTVFNDARIPDKRDHQALARELMQVIQLAAARAVPGRPADVVFGPQATIEKATHLVPDYHFLPEEKWPLTSKYVSSLSVSRWPIDAWMPWNCLNVMGAWVGADKNEFARILEGKAKKARDYDLAGVELWLVVSRGRPGRLRSSR